MQITVEIPDRFLNLGNSQEWEKNLKLYTALMLYQSHTISLSAGSELADIDLYTFMQYCSRHHIPVIDYEEGQLEAEVNQVLQDLA